MRTSAETGLLAAGRSPMKILYVHERLGSLGGAASNALITATAIDKRGHNIGLLHGESTGQGEAQWHATFNPRFQIDPKRHAESTQHALNTFKPDVVYVHKM